MNLITEIIKVFRKCGCCCPEFYRKNPAHSADSLQQHLVELPQLPSAMSLQPSRVKSRKHSGSYRETKSVQDQREQEDQKVMSNLFQSSGPKKNKPDKINERVEKNQQQQQYLRDQKKPVMIAHVDSNQNMSYDRRSLSQSSFQTLKSSSASRPLSRRNFKLLRKSSSFYAKHRQKTDQDFYSVNSSSSNNNTPKSTAKQQQRILTFKFAQNNQNYRDGIDLMNIWMKRQYQAYPSGRLVLSEIMKMKLQTKDLFDSLVHKLEDYYTFYFEDKEHFQQPMNLSRSMSKHYEQQGDNVHMQAFTYEEKDQQMICSVSKADGGLKQDMGEFNGCKFMTLIIIPHCSLPPLAFLQWFNKLQIQSSLHCFNKIQYLQDSQIIDEKVTLEYPLVRVEQFNQKLVGKQTLVLARQIEVAKFENDQDKETLLEVCFEVADEEKCFQRLVRVTAQPNDGSRAEIYIESAQNIVRRRGQQLFKAVKSSEQTTKNYQFSYFQQRWKRLQQKLNRAQVINKRTQVFRN